MPNNTHAVAPEDVMAYLDGELPIKAASLVATHLGQCTECQNLAAGLKQLSASLMSWEVHSPASQPTAAITAALDESHSKDSLAPVLASMLTKSTLWSRRPWLWQVPAAGLATVVVLFAILLYAQAFKMHSIAGPNSNNYSSPSTPKKKEESVVSKSAYIDGFTGGQLADKRQRTAGLTDVAGPQPPPPPSGAVPSTPMIASIASLTLTTASFDQARPRLDEILRQHQGYLGELNINSASGNSRTLVATLRITASQMDSTLTALKTLGRVDSESQNGEEVTAQYVDLQARLQNDRNTEVRLTELLRNRTGRLSDVLEVETEISRIRGSIEQMEAEQKLFEKRVALSTINLTINEEFKAHAQVIPNSTGTSIRNAAVDGYQTAVGSLVSLLLFLVSSGPTVILWSAILCIPARLTWKKWKSRIATKPPRL